jgi:hypothetical protein
MQYIPTRRVVTTVLAAAGVVGSLSLAIGQTQGSPPPNNSQLVPNDGRSSPPDRSRKVRPAIPQDTLQTPIQQPPPQSPPPGAPR